MKSRRYRLKYSAPNNSARWRCNFLECAHGMGLAGRGLCVMRRYDKAWWWDENCPGFRTMEALEKEMKEK